MSKLGQFLKRKGRKAVGGAAAVGRNVAGTAAGKVVDAAKGAARNPKVQEAAKGAIKGAAKSAVKAAQNAAPLATKAAEVAQQEGKKFFWRKYRVPIIGSAIALIVIAVAAGFLGGVIAG